MLQWRIARTNLGKWYDLYDERKNFFLSRNAVITNPCLACLELFDEHETFSRNYADEFGFKVDKYGCMFLIPLGIGNPPRTWMGKVLTFPYCFFGVPLFALFLYVIGDDVGKLIAVMYHESFCCSMCRHRGKSLEARQFQAASGNDLKEGFRRIQACVPVSLMLVVVAFYVLLAVLIFGLWENWDTTQSIYFCVMVLFTVGLVDEIPGITSQNSSVWNHTRQKS